MKPEGREDLVYLVAPVDTDENAAMTEAEAREAIDGIKVNLTDVAELAEALWLGRGWIPLGYGSWEELVAVEIAPLMPRLALQDRRNTVADLTTAGLSQRAIAPIVGVSVGTVNADLQVFRTEQVPTVGLDGKTYRANPFDKPARTEAQQAAWVKRQVIEEERAAALSAYVEIHDQQVAAAIEKERISSDKSRSEGSARKFRSATKDVRKGLGELQRQVLHREDAEFLQNIADRFTELARRAAR